MSRKAALSDEVRAALRPWYADELMEGVPVLRGSFFGWLFGLNGNHAVTINGTVHVTRRAPPEGSLGWTVLMGHELFHVEQQAAMGWWRFLLRYLWRYRPRHLRSARDHPYEIPAYARGREIRARLEARPIDAPGLAAPRSRGKSFTRVLAITPLI